MMAPNNHFATLGLSIGADENQIKKAYRTLAKKWHPDKNHEAGAKEKFQEIAASYEYLSSKDRREMLERELRKPAAPAPPKAPQSTPQTSSTNFSSTKKTKKPNEASWSETFTKNYQSQQAKAKSQAPGSSTFNFKSSERPSSFSFKFSHSHFESEKPPASPSFSGDDIFDELFRDFFDIGFGASSRLFSGLAVGPKVSPKLKKPKPRNVAPERGTPTGLDEEYLFTPRYKDNDGDGEKLSCPWCNQLFTRGKLAQHEEKCGKFGLSGDEDDDDDYDDESDEDMSFFTTLSRPEYAYKPVWQQKQEELREKIRRDKMRYREQTASHEAKDSSLIKCPYCDRQFNPTTAGTHIPWCKEYVKKYGIPMNFRSSKQGDYHESNDENFDYSTNLKKDTFSGTGRERATEYAKNIKKPSTSRKDTLENEKTGNDKKFPYTRPRMPSAFGVAGSKFASDPSGRDFGDMGYTPSPSDGPDKTRTTMRRSSVPGNFSNSKTTSGGKKPGSYRSDFKQKHS